MFTLAVSASLLGGLSAVVAERLDRGVETRRVVAMSTFMLIAACGIPSAPEIDSVPASPAIHSWAMEAAELLDAHRAELGCAPLRWHQPGAGVAEAYARQMNDEEFFGHVDPAGTTLKQRLTRAGIGGYRLAAETIAAGQDNPPKVVADWVASPDHKRIVEDCGYTEVGLGYHEGAGPYREYWTAVFFSLR